MFERAQMKMLPVTNRVADYGPVVPACCNICRTCTTTNVVGLAIGAATAAGYGIVRLARRAAGRAS